MSKDYSKTTWQDIHDRQLTPEHILWAVEAMDNEIRVIPDGSAWMCLQGPIYANDSKCGLGETASEAFADFIKQHGEPENPEVEEDEIRNR